MTISAPPVRPDTPQRPTRVRYVVVAVAVLMSVLLYLDRFCVSFAERYIKEDLALSETETALFVSLFFWSYALAQVPCGWLADRLGVRGVLSLYILVWSLFTALIGVSAGIVSLLAMRLGCGLAQAGAYPACGNLLSKWVPLANRGLASALVALGGRVGGAIAPVLTAYLMVLFVPLSTPALLTPASLLKPGALRDRLLNAAARAPVAAASVPLDRICELLPPEVHGQLLHDETSLAVGEDKLRELLASGLNGVLRTPDAFRADELSGLRNLEREALSLLSRRSAGSPLSDAESLRLNRLILEAIFPAEIGKLYVRGWCPVVMVYGLVGIVVAGVFWLFFRNAPAGHPWCNAAERKLIETGNSGPRDVTGDSAEENSRSLKGQTDLPIGVILRSTSLWLSSIAQFTTNIGWLFLVTFLARYLMEVHQVPILERSWMAAIPPIAGIAGMFLGGQLTDWLTRHMGVRWGRALPMAVTRFFAAAAYAACLWLDTPWGATIAFAFVFLSVDLGVSATWAFMQDVGGRHVGSILGWGNMWGNIGAAVAPPLYNAILGEYPVASQWDRMFLVCAGMFVVSGIAALGIDARVQIVPERQRGQGE